MSLILFVYVNVGLFYLELAIRGTSVTQIGEPAQKYDLFPSVADAAFIDCDCCC